SVVDAWSCAPEDRRPLPERVDDAHARGFLSLLLLAQALARSTSKDPLRMAVVTSGMQGVGGGGPVSPGRPPVLGRCRVLPQKRTHVSCQSIDIDVPSTEAE